MAVAARIMSESSGRQGTISIDFVHEIPANDIFAAPITESQFYFKINTTTTQVGSGLPIPIKMVTNLSDLALNGAKQSRSDTAADYTSITDMIEDYLFDTIHGHTANKYSSGVSAQGAMNI